MSMLRSTYLFRSGGIEGDHGTGDSDELVLVACEMHGGAFFFSAVSDMEYMLT